MQTTDQGLPPALNQPLEDDELVTVIRLLDRLHQTGEPWRKDSFRAAAFNARMERHEARALSMLQMALGE